MAKKPQITLRHLLGMSSLNKEIIEQLFESCQYFLDQSLNKNRVLDLYTNKTVALLFYEASTRTRNSFELAAKHLNAMVLNPNMQLSSTNKGESLLDTIHSLEAMGVDLFVIRHGHNNTPSFIATELKSKAKVINAGDGESEHPTQALIDLFTIKKHKKNFKDIKIAIVGDVLHSRVARSLVEGLHLMGTKDIHLISPTDFSPSELDNYRATTHTDLKEGLTDADVVVTLRIQKERMQTQQLPDPDLYYRDYGLTTETLAYAKPDAIVMHPGPMNRGVEIDSSVADGPQSVILEQVHNGVAMRMAVVDALFN